VLLNKSASWGHFSLKIAGFCLREAKLKENSVTSPGFVVKGLDEESRILRERLLFVEVRLQHCFMNPNCSDYVQGVRRSLSLLRWVWVAFVCASFAQAQMPTDPNALPTYDISAGDMVSIFAKNESLRRYGEQFAESVYEAAYETTGEPAGKGLVIIGNPEHPHPIMLVKKYLEFGDDDESTEKLLGLNSSLRGALAEWEKAEEELKKEAGLDIQIVVPVIPMPLERELIGLYLLARDEDFDDEKIEARFANIDIADLREASFDKYDWVIYLPPKNALDKVLRKALPKVLKKQKIGFFTRALVRGAIFTFKPAIRDALEGARKAILYDAILKSTSDLSKGDREALTNAYREALMPRGKVFGGSESKQENAFKAIREQKRKNAEYAKDPFVLPKERIEIDPASYSRYEGEYKWGGRLVRVYKEGETLYFKRGDENSLDISPVSEILFVSEKKKTTYRFIADESGNFAHLELRKERWRKKIGRPTEEDKKRMAKKKRTKKKTAKKEIVIGYNPN